MGGERQLESVASLQPLRAQRTAVVDQSIEAFESAELVPGIAHCRTVGKVDHDRVDRAVAETGEPFGQGSELGGVAGQQHEIGVAGCQPFSGGFTESTGWSGDGDLAACDSRLGPTEHAASYCWADLGEARKNEGIEDSISCAADWHTDSFAGQTTGWLTGGQRSLVDLR